MALVPRRIALTIAALAALVGSVVAPMTSASAADITAPSLISPANDPSAHLKDIVFKWTAVSGASQYQVQVSPNREWTNNTVDLPNNGIVVDPLFEMPVSLPNATFYWHVRAQVGGVWSPYSAPWTFVKDWESPITILKSPTTADPTIAWAAVKEASLYLIRYCPGACGNGTIGLQNGEVDCYTAETSVTPFANGLIVGGATDAPGPGANGGCEGNNLLPLVQGVAYGWELIAYDDSTAQQVTGDTDVNIQLDCEQANQPLCDITRYFGPTFLFDAPKAGTPSKGATVTGLKTSWHAGSLPGTTCDATQTCPMTPTFSWNPVPGANFYLVDVYRDPAMSNEYQQFGTSWPELTPSSTMFDAQAGQPYYWTVTAGTCIVSSSNPTCAAASTGASSCTNTGDAASKPTLGTDPADIKVNPPGPLGQQSMAGGSVGTVTLLGSQVVTGACVIPSDGFVDQNTVSVGFGGLVSFAYDAPTTATNEQVTFQVVNPDGGTSNASAPLTIVGGAQITLGQPSASATFSKRSGPITLVRPANHAVVTGTSPTFSWRDYLNSGADESYEARNYELEISQDRSFDTSLLTAVDVDLTQYTNPTSLLANGSYYWRVAAIDESGKLLRWSSVRQLTVNAVSPTLSFLSTDGAPVDAPLLIQLSTPLRNLTGQTLKVVPAGTPSANFVRGRLVEGASPLLYSFFPRAPLATGGLYGLRLTTPVYDTTGNAVIVSGNPLRTALSAPNKSAGWQYSRGWTRHTASGALSGSYVQAKGDSIATLQVSGSEITVYGCKAPNMGHLTVNVAGQTYTLSENQPFTRCGVPLWHGAIPVGIRTLTLRVASGTANFDEVTVDGGDTTGGTGTVGTGGTTTSG